MEPKAWTEIPSLSDAQALAEQVQSLASGAGHDLLHRRWSGEEREQYHSY
jgi:hypothetical protein